MEAQSIMDTGTTVELGRRYRDPITDWVGCATEMRLKLDGTKKVLLEGEHPHQGPIGFWIDERRLVETDEVAR